MTDPDHPEPTMEERVLAAMRSVLIDVIKDTTTDPRLKHPLSDQTRTGIRDCLDLITARQQELGADTGRTRGDRPHYIDEPRTSVSVPLSSIKRSGGKEPDKH